MSRQIIIGDIHGCIEEFNELLQTLEYRPNTEDELYLVGDLVDRGPDSVGCVRRVKQLGAVAVLGNHEEKYIRYARHEKKRLESGKPNPMKLSDEKQAVYQSLEEEDLNYLASLPLYHHINPELVMVHAGLEPKIPVKKQFTNALIRLRYVDTEKGRFVASVPGVRPAGAVDWATVWKGPESVVYGHAVHDLYNPRQDNPEAGVFCYGIDTGCCFGGVLTALVLYNHRVWEDVEFVRVRSKRKYAKFSNGE
jgi:bis(5'-nucleosyl)-tetraphosphatase (symmetrical)